MPILGPELQLLMLVIAPVVLLVLSLIGAVCLWIGVRIGIFTTEVIAAAMNEFGCGRVVAFVLTILFGVMAFYVEFNDRSALPDKAAAGSILLGLLGFWGFTFHTQSKRRANDPVGDRQSKAKRGNRGTSPRHAKSEPEAHQTSPVSQDAESAELTN